MISSVRLLLIIIRTRMICITDNFSIRLLYCPSGSPYNTAHSTPSVACSWFKYVNLQPLLCYIGPLHEQGKTCMNIKIDIQFTITSVEYLLAFQQWHIFHQNHARVQKRSAPNTERQAWTTFLPTYNSMLVRWYLCKKRVRYPNQIIFSARHLRLTHKISAQFEAPQ